MKESASMRILPSYSYIQNMIPFESYLISDNNQNSVSKQMQQNEPDKNLSEQNNLDDNQQ